MSDAIRIVLVRTSHPGNIGGAARAMANMGLGSLRLVAPSCFPHEEATARATCGLSVLEAASVHERLGTAIADAHLVIGTTARTRHLPWPVMAPREAARRLVEGARQGPVALVFGAERNGLTNEELQCCHGAIGIDTDPACPSLNLAGAVLLMAYELRCAARAGEGEGAPIRDVGNEPVNAAEMEGFFAHLERTLVAVGFLDPTNPGRLMARLRRLYQRARPDRIELNILRGILKATLRNL